MPTPDELAASDQEFADVVLAVLKQHNVECHTLSQSIYLDPVHNRYVHDPNYRNLADYVYIFSSTRERRRQAYKATRAAYEKRSRKMAKRAALTEKNQGSN